MLRSVIAVAAGCIVTFLLINLMLLVLGIVFPQAFPQSESFPSIPWVIFIMLYYLGASVIGGGVTTVSCRGSRIKHVHALALVSLFFGLAMLSTNIDKQPLWYSAVQVAAVLLGVYVGGHLANQRFPEEAVGR